MFIKTSQDSKVIILHKQEIVTKHFKDPDVEIYSGNLKASLKPTQ